MAVTKSRIGLVPSRWKFGKLPTEIIFNPNLSTHEKLLVGCLLWHGEGEVFPGRERLAVLMSCSTCQVSRAVKGLEDKGVLKVTREKGGINVYILIGGVVADSAHPVADSAQGVGAHSATNESNLLNENQERQKTTTPSGVAPASPTTPQSGKPMSEERQAIRKLVVDWFDTAKDNHFQRFPDIPAEDPAHRDTTNGAIINTNMTLLVRTYGPKMADQIFDEYWSWWERRPEINGKRDIYDFRKKMPMLRDIILERRSKNRRD